MPTVDYTYEIIAVTDRTMEIQYTHPTHGTTLVGARRPKTGEAVADVVAEYSPAAWWLEQEAELAPVTVGASGAGQTIFPEAPPPPTPEEALALWRESAVISQLQAHHTLKVWGLYDQVVALVTAAGDPLLLAFERAVEWRRNSPTISTLFTNLTMPDGSAPTAEVVDAFFTEAAGFEV